MSIFSNNRSELYRVIGSEFRSNNKMLTEKEWFNLFFNSSSTFSEDKPTNSNNKITYHNLFDYINNVKHSYLVGGGKYETSNQTIVDFYYGSSDNTSKEWKKSIVDKNEFYKTFACDLKWAKDSSYCGSIPPTPTPTPVDDGELKKLIGVYESDKTSDGKFRIFDATSTSAPDSKIQLGIMSYTYSYVSGLLTDSQKSGDELILKLSIDASSITKNSASSSLLPNLDLSTLSTYKTTITFSKDRQSFTYDMFGYKRTATKTTEKVTVINKTNVKKTDDKKTDAKVEKPYKPHVTTLKSKTTDYNDVGDGIFRKDYPFEVGNRNRLIGDINEKIYDSRRKDVYTQELLVDLKNIGAFGEDNYENVINKDVYDYVMNIMTPKDVIKESVKKVLKEYINRKK